jgi:hypothetical protein
MLPNVHFYLKRNVSIICYNQSRVYTVRFSLNPGLESREYSRRDPSRRPRGTVYPQKLALTSPTSGGRLVGIVRSQTQVMEFFLSLNVLVSGSTLFVSVLTI